MKFAKVYRPTPWYWKIVSPSLNYTTYELSLLERRFMAPANDVAVKTYTTIKNHLYMIMVINIKVTWQSTQSWSIIHVSYIFYHILQQNYYNMFLTIFLRQHFFIKNLNVLKRLVSSYFLGLRIDVKLLYLCLVNVTVDSVFLSLVLN